MLKLKKETYIWAKHANLLLFWHQPTNKILFCYTKSTSTQSPLLAAVLTAGGPQRWVALFDEIFVLLWRILVASINSL